MKQEIIDLFTKTKKTKIEFKPAIQVTPPYALKVWVDRIFKIGDNIMINVSNLDEDFNQKLDTVDDAFLKPLKSRLESIINKQ